MGLRSISDSIIIVIIIIIIIIIIIMTSPAVGKDPLHLQNRQQHSLLICIMHLTYHPCAKS